MSTTMPHDNKDGDKNVFDTEAQSDVRIVDSGLDDNDVIDQAYLTAPRPTRIFRSTLFQMFMFGAIAFAGPAMSDAIQNLGGGGLSTPYLANLATSLNYAVSTLTTLFGGPIINKIGIKWACILASLTMPLAGSGYYASARFGADAFLLAARCIGGVGNGLLYVGESTAMLSYPRANERGRYLGIWSAMRSSGSVIGGAINFGNNHEDGAAGGIKWSTYIVFIVFECTCIIFALLLSPTRKVRRRDGSVVPSSDDMSWKREFVALGKHLMHARTWLIFIPAFYSFFYGGTYGTYLSLHFSVRARALSSMIMPICSIVTTFCFGMLLDNSRWSQKTRAWIALGVWSIPQAGCFIWTGINYHRFSLIDGTIAYDYKIHGATWASYYFPYLIVFFSGYWTQLALYWMLGTFSTDVKSSSRTGGLFRAFETAGQAVSYAINSNTGDKRIPLYVNCALLALSVPCMITLIRMVPSRPADIDDVAGADHPDTADKVAEGVVKGA